MSSLPHRYTACWILPIDQPPIVNGEVEITGTTISYIGEIRPYSDVVLTNLGDAILMPGFVNAHTHLEYTALRGFLEDVEFFPWIRALTASKAHLTLEDWDVSTRLGALECIAAGITTIGDNTDAGVSARVCSDLGLRANIYQEIFGIDHREPVRVPMDGLKAKIGELSQYGSPLIEIGVSPHAPYTIRPAVFMELAKYCEDNKFKTSIHIAESPAEYQLLKRGIGPFAEMYKRRGIEWHAPLVSPTRYMYDLGMLTSRTLAVHCVHCDEQDNALLASSGVSIAHCPKSNAKLGAGIAPLYEWINIEKLTSQIGIGTDSAVSNNTLDLFEEMRFGLFLQRSKRKDICLTAKQMVTLATLGGAIALGLDNKVGTLTLGKAADIIAVKINALHGTPATDPYAALVYSSRADDVCLTIINGRILYQDKKFTQVDSESIRVQSNTVRQKLQ